MSLRSRPLAAALAAGTALLAALAPLAAPAPAGAQPAAPMAAAAPAPAAPAIDRANLDTTCAACANFFQFANGGWARRTTIPAAYPTWGSFNELAEANRLTLRRLLDSASAARGAPAGSATQKIGTFYRVCMDSATAERLGAEPVRPLLARIAALRTPAELVRALGPLDREAGLAPWRGGLGFDDKKSDERLAQLSQGGLGLPDRDYYLRPDSASRALRDRYQAHVERLLVLGGAAPADARADAARVLAFETRLARASMTRVEQRDPNAVYHRMPMAEAARLAPALDLPGYFRGLGARRPVTAVNVAQPAFFRAVNAMVTSEPLDAWKAYLRYHALADAAPTLSRAFVDEDFAFAREFTGASEQRPRWQRCAAATDDALGELLGQEYVKVAFTPAQKARMQELVQNLAEALRGRIEGLAWMSAPTKQQALAKLGAFTRKIGYPDRWRDYSRLTVAGDSYYADAHRAAAWARDDEWGKQGTPIDRGEWGMTPPTVNAYYNPTWNEIVFPAGILQPPFFFASADDAVNYGAIGAVIGHEMTHGFDDQGRQYDAQGNLRDWWTKADAARYDAEAAKVVAQFDAYTVVDSATHVNGKLTLGENIADLGGLKIAYAAMQRAYEGKPRPTIDGFTPEQRFFLGWAQVWRQLQRDQAARAQVAVDPHAPALWRVNGPLANLPEFRAAFGCRAGDPMVRPDAQRAEIW